MPYIRAEERERIDGAIEPLSAALRDMDAGAQNYVITRLLLSWVRARGVSYSNLADAIKILETAKLEFYRRALAAYEDRKLREHGDVYGDL